MSKEAIIITVVIVYVFIRSLFIEPGSIQITKYQVENNSLNGIRIAFLSDLHLKKGDYKRLDRIVKLTKKEAPDVVFFGGDFAKSPKKSKNMNMDFVAEKLSLLDRPMYSVLGDDDYLAGDKEIKDALEKHKVRILENSPIRTIIRGRYLDIIGIKDISTKDANVTKSIKRTRMPRIVLTHNPDIYYEIMDDVTLILAGHTHGGQIVLPLTPAMFVPSRYGARFASGYMTPRTNKLIISRGLGTDKAPFRFGCKPEIVIVDFVRAGTAKNKR